MVKKIIGTDDLTQIIKKLSPNKYSYDKYYVNTRISQVDIYIFIILKNINGNFVLLSQICNNNNFRDHRTIELDNDTESLEIYDKATFFSYFIYIIHSLCVFSF